MTWIIVILLISLNALYVAAEFAAVGVRRSRIRKMADEGSALAKGILPILEDGKSLDRYIAGCQIGITFSSLVLGAFGQATLARQLVPLFMGWGGLQQVAAQATAATAVLILLTTLQVVFGELVPKSLALQFPARTVLYTFLPMRWSLVAFSGFIRVLNGSGNLILKWFDAPAGGHRHIHSPEEIEMLLVESRDGGFLEPEEQQRLRQALRLGRHTARELMVPRRFVVGIEAGTSPEEALRMVATSPYTHLPVYRESLDQILGILHSKDLVAHYVKTGQPASAESLMRPLHIAPCQLAADRLLGIMRERRCHQIALLDEYGGFEGLVTLDDLIGKLFGEVADEFKGSQAKPEKLPDGRVRLPGLLPLDLAEEWIGVRWKSEAATVAGHVLWSLGRLPKPAERLSIDGVEIEVERMDERTIASLLVKPRALDEAS